MLLWRELYHCEEGSYTTVTAWSQFVIFRLSKVSFPTLPMAEFYLTLGAADSSTPPLSWNWIIVFSSISACFWQGPMSGCNNVYHTGTSEVEVNLSIRGWSCPGICFGWKQIQRNFLGYLNLHAAVLDVSLFLSNLFKSSNLVISYKSKTVFVDPTGSSVFMIMCGKCVNDCWRWYLFGTDGKV